MESQMQHTGEGVFHRPTPGHTQKHFSQAPGHHGREKHGQYPAADGSGHHTRCGQSNNENPSENATRLLGRRIQGPFESRAGGLRRRKATNRLPPNMHSVAASKGHVSQALLRPRPCTAIAIGAARANPGRRHVGTGNVLVALHHVVEVDKIAPGHRRQPTEKANIRGTPLSPQDNPTSRPDDQQHQRREYQDG